MVSIPKVSREVSLTLLRSDFELILACIDMAQDTRSIGLSSHQIDRVALISRALCQAVTGSCRPRLNAR